MRKIKLSFLIITTLLISSSLIAQQAIFERIGQVEVPTIENAGFGNIITGVDFDMDGATEVYAVNNMYDLGGAESVPRIYKFEWNAATSTWDSVWSAETNRDGQNTWPALTWGDWDGDGKYEVVYGPVNASLSPNPERIYVYEAVGDGSDNMGVDNGDGTWAPNASWTIIPNEDEQCRPFRWEMTDIDNDGAQEVVFGSRRGDRRFGVIGVSDIPDNGDGSETWELEVSGLSDTNWVFGGGTIYDMVVVDSTIYLFHSSGTITPVTYVNGVWTVETPVEDACPGGSWKSAAVVDVDDDGTKEIIVAGWSTGYNKIYLLQVDGASITTNVIADAAPMIGASGRFYGGWAGDTDGDGMMDYVTGTRGAAINAMIGQLSYKGGDITSPDSYTGSIIDQEVFDSGRWGLLHVADMNNDGKDEVIYASDWKGNDSGDPPYRVPLTILEYQQSVDYVQTATTDDDGDYIPDMLGNVMTVSGVVLNKSFSGSSFQVFIQDYTGGIQLFTNGNPGPDLNVGDRVIATGTVAQYRGLNELEIADPSVGVTVIDSNFSARVHTLTIDEYLADAETYEGSLVKIEAVAPTATSAAWPLADNNENLTLWTGYGSELTARVDKDTDVDDNAEPTWPITFTGVATQFTFDEPANNGYQVTFLSYDQIEQAIPVAPLPYFALLTPADGAVVSITDSSQTFDVTWEAATDLNNDIVGYQFSILPELFAAQAVDPTVTLSASEVLGLMAGADTLTVDWTVLVLDANSLSAASMDTFSVTFVNDIVVGVNDQLVPNEFYVDQNYPNPFNPSTTIKFGLPSESVVDLRIYDVLGREVAAIVNNKPLKAGTHTYLFDASNIASGTYIYRLTTGNKVVSKKMLLLK